MAEWTFLTNHARVLIALAQDPEARGRDVAGLIGITERAVQAIVADLTENRYLTKKREGRRNTYTINRKGRLRHPLESAHSVGELIDALS
jgi:predicted transcriptional regulator